MWDPVRFDVDAPGDGGVDQIGNDEEEHEATSLSRV
jgi:hypothetical protein